MWRGPCYPTRQAAATFSSDRMKTLLGCAPSQGPIAIFTIMYACCVEGGWCVVCRALLGLMDAWLGGSAAVGGAWCLLALRAACGVWCLAVACRVLRAACGAWLLRGGARRCACCVCRFGARVASVCGRLCACLLFGARLAAGVLVARWSVAWRVCVWHSFLSASDVL